MERDGGGGPETARELAFSHGSVTAACTIQAPFTRMRLGTAKLHVKKSHPMISSEYRSCDFKVVPIVLWSDFAAT